MSQGPTEDTPHKPIRRRWWFRTLKWIAILVGVFWLFYPRYSFNYRLTIEVETPDGIKTGSSDFHVSVVNQPVLLANPPIVVRTTGEAVFVDLGRGKNLVVLLTSNGAGRRGATSVEWLPLSVLEINYHGKHQLLFDWWRAWRGGKKEAPLSILPFAGSFKDINDKLTITVLDPRNADFVVGDEYRISRAEIEIIICRSEGGSWRGCRG